MNTVFASAGPALAGGLLIGLAAALFLLIDGRVAGISGITGGLLGKPGAATPTNLAFLAGLLAGPWLFSLLAGHAPESHVGLPWPGLIIAGLLVGFGTRLGSGCTSGHGVCGLARLSPRSIVAVLVFMVAAMVTVFVVRHGLGIAS